THYSENGPRSRKMRWTIRPAAASPLPGIAGQLQRRAESIADKPMFRDAFKRHRCIIRASGYYEWLKKPDGRQPYFISPADGSVLSFAGLWDRWKNPETGEPVIVVMSTAGGATKLAQRAGHSFRGGGKRH